MARASPFHEHSQEAASGFLAVAGRDRPDGNRRRIVPDISRTGRAGFAPVSLPGALNEESPTGWADGAHLGFQALAGQAVAARHHAKIRWRNTGQGNWFRE